MFHWLCAVIKYPITEEWLDYFQFFVNVTAMNIVVQMTFSFQLFLLEKFQVIELMGQRLWSICVYVCVYRVCVLLNPVSPSKRLIQIFSAINHVSILLFFRNLPGLDFFFCKILVNLTVLLLFSFAVLFLIANYKI